MVISLLMGGCQEPTTRVGSACADGICPQRNDGLSGEACLFQATNAVISIEGQGFVDLCLPDHLPIDGAGQVPCSVRIDLPAGSEGCAEGGFSPPEASDPHACIVPQLTRQQRAQSGVRGWYYREDNTRECVGGVSAHFTEGTIPDNVRVRLDCLQALEVDAERAVSEASVNECRLPDPEARNTDVGAACLPLVPERGFDDRNASISTATAECASGACLVYKLRGDPSPDCVPRAPDEASGDPGTVCVEGEELEQRVYCSCRCNAPEGDPGELCDCPAMFSCVEVLEEGPPGVRGSYCVRDGTFISEAQ